MGYMLGSFGAIFVALIAALMFAAMAYFTRPLHGQNNNSSFFSLENSQVTSTPSPTTTPSPSPKTATISIAGTITDSGGKVKYKNSTLLIVDSITNLYVTKDTVIIDSSNNTLSQSAIEKGSYVLIDGIPIEGGIEAKKITLASPSPSE